MSGRFWLGCGIAFVMVAGACGKSGSRPGAGGSGGVAGEPAPSAEAGSAEPPAPEGGAGQAPVAAQGGAGQSAVAPSAGEGGAPPEVLGGQGGVSAAGEAGAGGSEPEPYLGCHYQGSANGVVFQLLDKLAGPAVYSYPLGVSDDGLTVVGTSAVDDTHPHAVTWTPDGQLHDLNVATNGLLLYAYYTSCDGSVVLAHAQTLRYRYSQAGGAVEVANCGAALPHLGIWGMDDTGSVMVGACQDDFDTFARRWYGNDPPLTIANQRGWGLALSADGLIFAGVQIKAAVYSVFRYSQAGGNQVLFKTNASLLSMSADGSTLVSPDETSKRMRWRNGVITPLPCVDTAQSYCDAGIISGDGRTILVDVDGEQMIWHDDEPLEPLRDVIEALGVDLSPWKYFSVHDMTADKRVLVGRVSNDNSADIASFYLVLPPGTL